MKLLRVSFACVGGWIKIDTCTVHDVGNVNS